MEKYAGIIKHEETKYLAICFWIEKDKPFQIGEKINEINELAYMNGYNWEAFLNYYLRKYHPDIIEGMETDSEGGMYVAYYELNPENEQKAERFVEIIQDLIENEEVLYEIVKNEGMNIEWD